MYISGVCPQEQEGASDMNKGQNAAPVKAGDELDVRIDGVGGKGDGIARHKGFVLFVPGTQKGEVCRIRVTKVSTNMGFAQKIGDAQGPVGEQQRSRLAPVSVKPVEESHYQDSDDFGEEDEESLKE